MPIVDCVYERGQFFLPLSLNGAGPHHFIFDTGAGVSAVGAVPAGWVRKSCTSPK